MNNLNEYKLETIELVNSTQEAENLRLMFSIRDSLYNLKDKLKVLDFYVNNSNLNNKNRQKTLVKKVV